MKPIHQQLVLALLIMIQQAHTFVQMNGMIIFTDLIIMNNDENNQESFQEIYGKDSIMIGKIKPDNIATIKLHLKDTIEVLADNPVNDYFKYLLELCNDYSKLKKLSRTIDNIYDFAAESGGVVKKSGVSFNMGQMNFGSDYQVPNSKRFLATTLQTDNADKIKAIFDEFQEQVRVAHELRDQQLAGAAEMRAYAAEQRARAAEQRAQAAEQRAQVARNRAQAQRELERAAEERERAVEEMEMAAEERENAAALRKNVIAKATDTKERAKVTKEQKKIQSTEKEGKLEKTARFRQNSRGVQADIGDGADTVTR